MLALLLILQDIIAFRFSRLLYKILHGKVPLEEEVIGCLAAKSRNIFVAKASRQWCIPII